jgi:hypothetical protein
MDEGGLPASAFDIRHEKAHPRWAFSSRRIPRAFLTDINAKTLQ